MGSEFSTTKDSNEDSISDIGLERTEYDDEELNYTSSFNCFSTGYDSSHSRGMVGGLFGEIIGSDNVRSSFKPAEWNSSQYEGERHFYSDDVELENGYIKSTKPRSPTARSGIGHSFDSSCCQLTPAEEEEENVPSDEEITKIMYQQYVLQYHLTLYRFPSDCEEFYDYYFE